MHDIDRALFEQQEWSGETGYEAGSQETGYETGSQETGYETEFETYEMFGESADSRETALAAELLEISNEAELDRFLGSFLSKAVSAVKNFASSDIGKAVGGVIKGVAKQALPSWARSPGTSSPPASAVPSAPRPATGSARGWSSGWSWRGCRPRTASSRRPRPCCGSARRPPSAPRRPRAVPPARRRCRWPGPRPWPPPRTTCRAWSSPGPRSRAEPARTAPTGRGPIARRVSGSGAGGASCCSMWAEGAVMSAPTATAPGRGAGRPAGRRAAGGHQRGGAGGLPREPRVVRDQRREELHEVRRRQGHRRRPQEHREDGAPGRRRGAGLVPPPGVGTAIGARLGSVAGGLLEVGEAEALGEAEAEYEAAQRYVRFARSAYVNAARAPRNAPPRAVARAATVTAARRYAPGLLRDRGQDGGWGRRRGGRRRPGSSPRARVPHVRLGRPLGRRRQRRIHLAGLRGAGVDAAGGPRPRRRAARARRRAGDAGRRPGDGRPGHDGPVGPPRTPHRRASGPEAMSELASERMSQRLRG